MQYHLNRGEGPDILRQNTVVVNYAVLPQRGEDSFAVLTNEQYGLLCVADGCGGLGSRRYRELKDHTGAFVASRLVVRYLQGWAKMNPSLPSAPLEGRKSLDKLENELHSLLHGFARENGLMESAGRIVGSLQRVLPSTLCAAFSQRGEAEENCWFLWAGDSRGYGLDKDGLRQYTQDDLRARLDPFECQFCDSPLSNCLSADQPIRLHMRRVSLRRPCLIVCATDGAFSCLPTPMEFEMLLLSTMQAAQDQDAWQLALESALSELAGDDATLLCRPNGFESYAAMRQYFTPRFEELSDTWIMPVRQNARDRDFARRKWEGYRIGYDRTEGTQNEPDDWRI